MIYIFSALYQEAAGIIRYYGLKRQDMDKRFQVFAKDNIILTVTGTGLVMASSVVACVLTHYGAGKKDLLINIGTCAGMEGRSGIFLCHKLRDEMTGRTFYPDLLWKSDLAQAEVTTVAKILTGEDIRRRNESLTEDEVMLYDMEAAAVYQAGSLFMGPHQMSFVKVISDAGVNSEKNPQRILSDIQELMKNYLKEIVNYIDKMSEVDRILEDNMADPVTAQEQDRLDGLARDLWCSQSMKNELKQYYRYCVLAKIPFWDYVLQGYSEEKIPCRNRREGKDVLNELTGKIL